MTLPTVSDMLRNIEATLAEKVEPALGDIGSRSALVTVGHLLSYVRIRIEREGPVLMEELDALKALLEQAAAYHDANDDRVWSADIRQALAAARAPDAATHRSLDDLAGEVAALRRIVHEMLARLQQVRGERAHAADYQAIRSAIRIYTVHQIEAEGELVAAGFFGRGARR